MEAISFVKACQTYFSTNPHGRKIEISEFKDLDDNDKRDLREMLIGELQRSAPRRHQVANTSSAGLNANPARVTRPNARRSK